MNIYQQIKERVNGYSFPIGGTNESGEHFIIEECCDAAGDFIRVTAAQFNDWLRINTYYANGDRTEEFKR